MFQVVGSGFYGRAWKRSHPPATAGGTDRVQVRLFGLDQYHLQVAGGADDSV